MWKQGHGPQDAMSRLGLPLQRDYRTERRPVGETELETESIERHWEPN